jgi:hypothetical protein
VNLAKRSEHVNIKEFKYRSESNTFVSSKIYFELKRTLFICKNLNIEAKRSKLMLNCESSEANMFILKNSNIEAKRTGSIVIL